MSIFLRRTFLKSARTLAVLFFILPVAALAGAPISVVTTFSILADMVERIGGEHVAVTALVGRNGDVHVYRPTTQAAKAVKEADILFMNGLEFENWFERLSEAVAFEGTLVIATKGIEPIAFEEHGDEHDDHGDHDEHGDEHDDHGDHDEHGDDHDEHDEHGDHDGHAHGVFDPHAWMSPVLAVTYVDNITVALAQASPANASVFFANRAKYIAEIEALHVEISAMMSSIPKSKRVVVTSHDAFQYFARDYGLTFKSPQGLSTDSEASARDVARLIEQMKEQNISAVFIENLADSRLIKRIADETGATVGGILYTGALSEKGGPAATYLDLLRHNATTVAEALGD